MQTLLDKKKLLEAEDQSIEMEVLLDFLNSTKKRKMEVCSQWDCSGRRRKMSRAE
jgi:hypothetical protein